MAGAKESRCAGGASMGSMIESDEWERER